MPKHEDIVIDDSTSPAAMFEGHHWPRPQAGPHVSRFGLLNGGPQIPRPDIHCPTGIQRYPVPIRPSSGHVGLIGFGYDGDEFAVLPVVLMVGMGFIRNIDSNPITDIEPFAVDPVAHV